MTAVSGVVRMNIAGMSDADLEVVRAKAAREAGADPDADRGMLAAIEDEIRLRKGRKPVTYDVEAIAPACHEANRRLQIANGEPPDEHWEDAPEWQRDSTRDSVRMLLAGQSAEQLFESWCDRKRADGWVYGPVKSTPAKTHPCLVPYGELPEAQKAKDRLFAAIVSAMTGGDL